MVLPQQAHAGNNTRFADSADRWAPAPAAESGRREGESKWVRGGIGGGSDEHKNWRNHGENGDMGKSDSGNSIRRIVGIGMNYMNLVVIDIGIAGIVVVGRLVACKRNNPFLFCFVLFYGL